MDIRQPDFRLSTVFVKVLNQTTNVTTILKF